MSLLAVSLVALAVSAVGLAIQILPRSFSPAQRQQIQTWEQIRRWQTWPAGRIFPAAVGYRLAGRTFGGGPGIGLSAHRIGISPAASCRSGLDTSVAKAFGSHGCVTVLRATYDDATQTLAVTVGVVVASGPAPARAAARALPGGHRPRPGVRTVAFRRTPAARFGAAQRQLTWHERVGPYLVLATVGYSDGRRRTPVAEDRYLQGEMLSLARGVGRAVAGGIGATPPPVRCPGGPAC